MILSQDVESVKAQKTEWVVLVQRFFCGDYSMCSGTESR